MKKLASLITFLASSTLAASVALAADVCVQIDESKDNLPEADRAGAKTLLAQALESQGERVVATGCTGTYTVSHVKLGNSVTVTLTGPQGTRQVTARSIDDLPALYSQMVTSLVTGKPMTTSGDTVDRTNATSAQAAPNRVEADSLWYARLGFAGIVGAGLETGPSFGVGYRFELDDIGIDASFFNLMVVDSEGQSSGGATGSWVKLMGLYFLDPQANRSAYVGGGISWGAVGVVDDNKSFSDSGLQAELSAGYELLRASTIRLFVQADATLPLYLAESIDLSGDGTATGTDSIWAPSFGISLGVGWGKGATRVRVIK
ncbi:MAG: hypothetical protein HY698_00255 [Deltaproteobacteria bacterium]|nr:hypothetical protein [Deltaproteobacteria bacterium]